MESYATFPTPPLDLPERRNRCTSNRVIEVNTQNCPCGTAMKSRTNVAGKCKLYKEQRDVVEGKCEL